MGLTLAVPTGPSPGYRERDLSVTLLGRLVSMQACETRVKLWIPNEKEFAELTWSSSLASTLPDQATGLDIRVAPRDRNPQGPCV